MVLSVLVFVVVVVVVFSLLLCNGLMGRILKWVFTS